MSSSGDTDVATRALVEGACFFLFKPVCPQDLAKVWQHVFRKRGQRAKLSNVVESKEDQRVQDIEKACDANQEDNAEEIIRDPVKGKAPCTDDDEGKKGRKRAAEENVVGEKLVIGGNDKRARNGSVHKRKKREKKNEGDSGKNVEKGKEKKNDEDDGKNVEKGKEKKNDEDNGKNAEKGKGKRKIGQKRKAKRSDEGPSTSSPADKKPRMMWTPVLHQKFIQAVAILGEDSEDFFPKF